MINQNRIGKASVTLKRVMFGFVIASFMGLASQVGAVINLTTSSSQFLGITPAEPSDSTSEASYINFLVALAPNTIIGGPSSPPDYQRSGNTLCYPSCPTATATGSSAVTGNSGSFGTGFTYLLGKYDGPNLGDVIWYVAGLTGDFTIPTCVVNVNGTDTTCYGLSHAELFNGTTTTATPGVPEPGTLVLLGSGLVVLGVVARRRYSKN